MVALAHGSRVSSQSCQGRPPCSKNVYADIVLLSSYIIDHQNHQGCIRYLEKQIFSADGLTNRTFFASGWIEVCFIRYYKYKVHTFPLNHQVVLHLHRVNMPKKQNSPQSAPLLLFNAGWRGVSVAGTRCIVCCDETCFKDTTRWCLTFCFWAHRITDAINKPPFHEVCLPWTHQSMPVDASTF